MGNSELKFEYATPSVTEDIKSAAMEIINTNIKDKSIITNNDYSPRCDKIAEELRNRFRGTWKVTICQISPREAFGCSIAGDIKFLRFSLGLRRIFIEQLQ